MPRENLTPAFCLKATVENGAERTIYWHEKREGFGLMVTAKGARSYVVQYRAGGKSRRMTIDGKLSLSAAERQAKKLQGKVADGGDSLTELRAERAARSNSLKAVAESYFKREGKKLRSIDQREALFARHIFPRFGAKPIDSIKRSEINRLLDHVEDNSGARTAQQVLAVLSRLFNWHATQDDDFLSPIVRGMGRINQRELARSRILTDDELRAVCAAASEDGPFPALVQFLLLTAARRGEASDMRWDEIKGSIWTLPASRNKTKEELARPLSRAAMDVLARMPRVGEYAFTYNGHSAVAGFSRGKEKFDKACGVIDWTLHDLRRTARSLMSRAGVPQDHAERCLGHVIAGVRGTYDRHRYLDEMLHAYEALAAQIERIVNPQENVVALRG
jgi:integrase